MATQIVWGKLNFNVNGKVAHGVSDFAASLSKKSESSKSKKKFTEAETISFKITSTAMLGGSPINDYDYLKSFIGISQKLKINLGMKNKLKQYRAGGAKFILEQVELSNTTMDNFGRIITADISLSFTEDLKDSAKYGSEKKVKKKIRKPAKKVVKKAWKKE